MSGNYRNCHMRFIFGLVPWCYGWWATEVGMLLLCSWLTLKQPTKKKTKTKPTQQNTHKKPPNKPKSKQPPAHNTKSVIEMNVILLVFNRHLKAKTRLFLISVNLWWIFALKYVSDIWCPTKVISDFELYVQILH